VTDPSYAARMGQHAAERGDRPAVSIGDETVTHAELHRWSNRLARHLAGLGATQDSFVTIAEPNSIEFLAATIACWKLGATPQPVSSRLPPRELEAIVELAEPAVVVGVGHHDRPSVPSGFRPGDDLDDTDLPDAVAAAWKAPTSGGSTGRPKLIVSGDPSVWRPATAGLATLLGAEPDGVMVMPGPLYHNGPFIWSCMTLLQGGHVALLPRFDSEATLATIERHRGTALYAVPTMMQRIWKLPEDTRQRYDLSSLRKVWHLAEPCPPWLKEAWIDWLGPEVIWELYGGTEGMASTVLDGREWLEHRGSVGKPISGEIRIQGEDGTVLPAGEVGEVWMRATERDTPTYRYIGAESEIHDGWECLGDIGWMDEDGYLYLADRRSDMILVGGANVYPAEVEAALGEHPRVRSCAVIGLPDEELGNRVHAIVEADGEMSDAELGAFLSERLVRYKVPRSFEFVTEALRDEAGKVRRSALRADRLAAG
jgi:bile acid-coenzyme A ligase